MSENAEYFFCHFPLEYGIIGALDNANETSDDMARDGWLIDHVAMSGSFLLLVFKRTRTPTPPHQTTDRDVPTTC